MKKLILFPLSIVFSLNASPIDDIAFKGDVQNTTQYYIKAPDDKHKFNNTASVNLELEYLYDALTLKTKLKAQEDFYDFYEKSKKNQRSFVRLDELYGTYDFDEDQIFIGKNIRFWGALEVRNITDSFNSQDMRSDIFTSDKLGAWNASYAHYTESGEFDVIIKFYEQDRDMAALPYVYYFFPAEFPLYDASGNINGLAQLQYKNKLLTESSHYRPSIYLKYSGSTDTEYALDYAVIFENGYDSQRYYTFTQANDRSKITTRENAYLVNKISTYDTLVVGSTLVKLEALYTDVINDVEISDYYHIGLGVEYTISQVYSEADLGLISEYYYYDILDDTKRNDLQLFETLQNDLFLGFRYTFNDGNDGSVVAGSIIDLDYSEEVYYLEYETRVADVVKLNFDYRYTNPSKNRLTAFNLLGKHERVSLTLGYYF